MAFGGKAKAQAGPAIDGTSSQQLDEEVGLIRGIGSGPGKDGAGLYEMVGLGPKNGPG